jgi:1-acyl-sn-glycerol-3-phosphate acyltransferase
MFYRIKVFWVTCFIQRIIYLLCKIPFKYFFNLNVIGLENLSDLRQVIFAVNHTSQFDPFFLNSSLSFLHLLKPIFFVARERKFYGDMSIGRWLYGKYLFQILGAHRVYVGLKDYRQAFVNHIEILNAQGSVCIFPEGTRTKDGEIHEARGGVGFLSSYLHIPVIPVYISQAFGISFKSVLSRKHSITVCFGKPIFPKRRKILSHEESKEFSNKIMDEIRALKVIHEYKIKSNQ